MRTLRTLLSGVATALGLAAAAMPAHAYTQSVLHSFCSSASCADGSGPNQLVKHGNALYGVASNGGSHASASHAAGVVFKYDLGTSTYSVLYNFCSTIHLGVCSDGEAPSGVLVLDGSGNIYGTTGLGGNSNNAGTVYKLTNNSGTYSLTGLYQFCPVETGNVECTDGDEPLSGLAYYGQASGSDYDGTSALYGTTYVGGWDAVSSYGNGTLFELTHSGGTWTFSQIYVFCPGCQELCATCTDGELPIGPMVVDASGNVYGSTRIGGGHMAGKVYKFGSGTLTTLYDFCPTGTCGDGQWPSGVMMDASGNVYGGTDQGGAHNAGVFYKLTNSSGTYTQSVKHDFCGSGGCSDGWAPRSALIMDGSSNIYGVTGLGGNNAHATNGAGTVWKYNGTSESVLYSFCPSSGCADGQGPGDGVIMDGSGNLYGSAGRGGSNSAGVIYKLAP